MRNKIRELAERNNGWGNEYRAMKLAQDQGSLLETMEESQDKVPYDKEIRTDKMEGTRDGELQKKDMAVCNHVKQCAD